eukprot:559149-Amorphochlora_amoeboformis.AAC.2
MTFWWACLFSGLYMLRRIGVSSGGTVLKTVFSRFLEISGKIQKYDYKRQNHLEYDYVCHLGKSTSEPRKSEPQNYTTRVSPSPVAAPMLPLVVASLALLGSAAECNGNGVYNATTGCSCNSGYSGESCESAICEPECLNDGLCNGPNSCSCPVGFAGPTCENISVFGDPIPSCRVRLYTPVLTRYAIVAIASWVMGNVAPKIGLPKITAYIGTGVLAGTYVLGIINEDEIRDLDVVDKVSLAYIAFAAGSKPIVGGRSILTVTFCLVLFTFSLVSLVMVLIAPTLEFTKDLTASQQGGVAILVGTLACARSPSSAIAIIDDLRAAGPFTILTMAVTCVMDVLVIFMFAVNNLIASAQFDTGGNPTVLFGKSMA